MERERIDAMMPDLFSTALPRERSLLTPSAPNSTADMITRHVLPNDLPSAIKQLNDQELEQLLAAVTAEQQRPGKTSTAPEKTPSKRVEAQSVSLTPGKLNAVRAAFKAGVRPSKIAQQFGISQSDVRKVLASGRPKPQALPCCGRLCGSIIDALIQIKANPLVGTSTAKHSKKHSPLSKRKIRISKGGSP